ncbi:hypothetical protein Elgi_36850 [Paenibacillus elgii]|uniref:hypothetical protein n=1 Tax=Paenibacillus elgii TaxID=189691 RepID=UPI002D7AF22D|nr:hypothetical protein Elgi_36850 [Paenibacillus elgii]
MNKIRMYKEWIAVANSEEFQEWLVEEYRMHVEEFNSLDRESKIEVIEQYQNRIF